LDSRLIRIYQTETPARKLGPLQLGEKSEQLVALEAVPVAFLQLFTTIISIAMCLSRRCAVRRMQ
jgi:hypothetical protein